MISEEVEHKRTKSKKKFEIAMSDKPGAYDIETLKEKLAKYLSKKILTAQRMRDVFFPACLKQDIVTRDQLRDAFVEFDESIDASKTGYFVSLMSSQLGMEWNDFLRQVLGYEYPNHPWEKDNYFIRDDYRELVKEVLDEVCEAIPATT